MAAKQRAVVSPKAKEKSPMKAISEKNIFLLTKMMVPHRGQRGAFRSKRTTGLVHALERVADRKKVQMHLIAESCNLVIAPLLVWKIERPRRTGPHQDSCPVAVRRCLRS